MIELINSDLLSNGKNSMIFFFCPWKRLWNSWYIFFFLRVLVSHVSLVSVELPSKLSTRLSDVVVVVVVDDKKRTGLSRWTKRNIDLSVFDFFNAWSFFTTWLVNSSSSDGRHRTITEFFFFFFEDNQKININLLVIKENEDTMNFFFFLSEKKAKNGW